MSDGAAPNKRQGNGQRDSILVFVTWFVSVLSRSNYCDFVGVWVSGGWNTNITPHSKLTPKLQTDTPYKIVYGYKIEIVTTPHLYDPYMFCRFIIATPHAQSLWVIANLC